MIVQRNLDEPFYSLDARNPPFPLAAVPGIRHYGGNFYKEHDTEGYTPHHLILSQSVLLSIILTWGTDTWFLQDGWNLLIAERTFSMLGFLWLTWNDGESWTLLDSCCCGWNANSLISCKSSHVHVVRVISYLHPSFVIRSIRWKYGSQSPMLLVFHKNYVKLDNTWNADTLGYTSPHIKGKDLEHAGVLHWSTFSLTFRQLHSLFSGCWVSQSNFQPAGGGKKPWKSLNSSESERPHEQFLK